jgi:hypothetical protein
MFTSKQQDKTYAHCIFLPWPKPRCQHVSAADRFDLLDSAELRFQEQLKAKPEANW